MNQFPHLVFDSMNEADVREEVIAPLLKALGYRSGTELNVIREQYLRYPKSFLGHKNPSKDPELRGKADYILEVKSLIRWVIEAKSPNVEIGLDDIQQAWSYANHAEVRAVYFSLCNGRVFQVFQTNHGPNAGPILSVMYEQLDHHLGIIADLVGPVALLRDHPRQEVDQRPPLGPGLRSIARVLDGWMHHDYNNLGQKVLNELRFSIPYGAIERNEHGGLSAFLKVCAPIHSHQDLNEKLGLDMMDMQSNDSELSLNPQRPTAFTYRNSVTIPAGEKMLDLEKWQEIVTPINLHCDMEATAHGFLAGHVFSGRFVTRMNFPQANMVAEMSGPFHLYVA